MRLSAHIALLCVAALLRFIHVPGLDLDLSGSYETGFFPDDSNAQQWPIPNVLGVKAAALPNERSASDEK